MLTQHITGQGQIGFEFANAGSIDQGRKLVNRETGLRKPKLKLKVPTSLQPVVRNLSSSYSSILPPNIISIKKIFILLLIKLTLPRAS
jgi:hypothetical protein